MWEWSKSNSTCVKALKNKITLEKIIKSDESVNNYTKNPQQMHDFLEQQLLSLGFKNIKFKTCKYYPQTWTQMLKNASDYQRVRKNFLKFLGYSQSEHCQKCGLSYEDINLLKSSISPENFNTHIKIPFDFGGDLSFENLCLIKTHPFHDQIHCLIEQQISTNFLQQHKIIYIPYFEGYLYNE